MRKIIWSSLIVILGFFSILYYFNRSKHRNITVNIAIPSKIENISLFKSKSAQERFLIPLIFDTLFIKDLQGDFKSVLVRKFHFSSNEIHIALSRHVLFSDGSRLTADDVYDSFQKYCTTKDTEENLHFLEGCKEKNIFFKKINDYEFVLKATTHPNYAIEQFANGNNSIFKEKDGIYIGTSLFKLNLAKIEFGQFEMIFNEKNNFWSNKYQRARLVFHQVKEDEILRENILEQYDFAMMYLRTNIHHLEKRNYVNILHANSISSALILNPQHEAFRDLKKRVSIRDLIQKIDFKLCRPSIKQSKSFIPEGVGGYLNKRYFSDQQVDSFARNYSKHQITLYRHTDRRNDCEEEKIKEVFEKFNVDVKFEHHQDYKFLMSKYLDRKTAGYVEFFVFNLVDAISLLKRFLNEEANNIFFYTSNTIIENLRKASDKSKVDDRFYFYQSINKEIYKDASIITLYSLSYENFIKKCLFPQGQDFILYNPNPFLMLMDFDYDNKCFK